MTSILGGLLLAGAAVVAVPTLVFCAECTLGLMPSRRRQVRSQDSGSTGKMAIVVPAHNESSVIGCTVEHLKEQLIAGDVIIVVADNCDDNTAQKACEAGATVIERHNLEQRGKGFALSFATSYLKTHDTPDAVVVIDADCRVTKGRIRQIADLAITSRCPVQADDVVCTPDATKPGARLSVFAFRVRNWLRPRGLQRMGGSVHLAGTGMAFPWDTFAHAPSMTDHLAEDLALGIELTLAGHRPLLFQDVQVSSELAPSEQGQTVQRRRWEAGHLQTMRRYLPRLLGQAVQQRSARLLLSALDLSVPPLALHVLVVLGGCGLGAFGFLLGTSPLPLVVFLSAGTMLLASIGMAWLVVGRDVLRLRDWAVLPSYVLAKLPGYFGLFVKKQRVAWDRAERKS